MKMNKEGFTLAELLIVIAIIAILIAIAIPVFAGQLENARLQADHANIRNAYALMQVANISGEIEVKDGIGTALKPISDYGIGKELYFQKDGSLDKDNSDANAYATMSKGSADKCASSVGCHAAGGTHDANQKIKLTYNASTDKIEISFE